VFDREQRDIYSWDERSVYMNVCMISAHGITSLVRVRLYPKVEVDTRPRS